MSAEACVGYFGLRYEVGTDEIDRLEARTDPRQIEARNAGVTSYWGNFGGEADRYVLFVGAKIAILGPENDMATGLPVDRVLSLISDTTDRIRSTNLTGAVGLYLEWLEDA